MKTFIKEIITTKTARFYYLASLLPAKKRKKRCGKGEFQVR